MKIKRFKNTYFDVILSGMITLLSAIRLASRLIFNTDISEYSIFKAVTICLILSVLSGYCNSINASTLKAGEGQAIQEGIQYPDSEIDENRFRELFFSALKKDTIFDGKNEKVFNESKHLFIYGPVMQSLKIPKNSSDDADKFLKGLREEVSKVTPLSLYNRGVVNDSRSVIDIQKILLDVKRVYNDEPVTIIVVPGFVTEFIETNIFNALFKTKSTFKKSWKVALKKRKKEWKRSSTDKRKLVDPVFSLMNLDEKTKTFNVKDTPMKELVYAASIDTRKGEELVRVLLLKTPSGSLETMGTVAETAISFNRRIDNAFAILGTISKNIVLLGYSRGAPISLEMITSAQNEKRTWFNNVRGIISYSGAVNGSAMAGEKENSGDLASDNKGMGLLLDLFNNLYTDIDEWNNMSFKEMEDAIKQHVDEMRMILASMKNVEDSGVISTLLSDTEKEGADDKKKELTKTQKLLKFNKLVKFLASKNLLDKKPIRHYPHNNLRLQKIFKELLLGVDGIQQASCTSWWKENTLPTNGIRFYTILGSLNNERGSKLFQNPLTTNMNSKVYKRMLQRYMQQRKLLNAPINDGLIDFVAANFWERLFSMMPTSPESNPKITFLGVVAASHMDMAYPFSNIKGDSNKNYPVSPFPRTSLLLSLAAAVGSDLLFDQSGR